MKTPSAQFETFRSRRSKRQWIDLICITACTLTAVITLVPAVGDRWSQATYPAIASVDRALAPYGVAIGPENHMIQETLESTNPLSEPLNAIVFGNIQPDETVVELSFRDRLAPMRDVPEVRSLNAVTRPVHWQRTGRATPPSSEPHTDRR